MTDPLHRHKFSGLEGQRVAITGGASGIGLVTARVLHAQGAKIAICDIGEQALETASAALGNCPAVLADVSDETAVDNFFAVVQDQLGGLDGLVNNAGIAGPTGPIEDLSLQDWNQCLSIGLTGQFLCARHAVRMLKTAGGGAMVNMSSAAGKHGYAFRTPYSSTKFGVIGFTQSLAKELGPSNIRVNAVLPGIVEGARMDSVIENRAKQFGQDFETTKSEYLAHVSLRRMVSPDDVANTIAFLLSTAGQNLSGQSLAVDGNVETL